MTNEQVLKMSPGFESGGFFGGENSGGFDDIQEKLTQIGKKAREIGDASAARLEHVRGRIQQYAVATAEIAKQKVEYAIEHPVEAAQKVAKEGWIYGVGAAVRYGVIVSGTAAGYLLYPIAAVGSATMSMVVGGYKDWKRIHDKNGALNTFRHYAGGDSLKVGTVYADGNEGGVWGRVKNFVSRNSFTVKEGYRRAYESYTYHDKLQVMKADLSSDNLQTYDSKISQAIRYSSSNNDIFSIQADLRQKITDASYAISVATNNQDRKDGQEAVRGYFELLSRVAEHTNLDTREFMREIAVTKNAKLESSAKKAYAVSFLSRGTWSMVKYGMGGALLGRFGSLSEMPSRVQTAFQHYFSPDSSDAHNLVSVRIQAQDTLSSPNNFSGDPSPKQPNSVKGIFTLKESHDQHEVVGMKQGAREVPRCFDEKKALEIEMHELKARPKLRFTTEFVSHDVTINSNQGLFSALEDSNWGETGSAGSATRFMEEVVPAFRGNGLTEEHYQELMAVVAKNPNISAEELWKKFKWFDRDFIVQPGTMKVMLKHTVPMIDTDINHAAISADTVGRERIGAMKVLYSPLHDDPPPKDNVVRIKPSGDATGSTVASNETVRVTPGGGVSRVDTDSQAALWQEARERQQLQSATRPQFYVDPESSVVAPVPVTAEIPVAEVQENMPTPALTVSDLQDNAVRIVPSGERSPAAAILPNVNAQPAVRVVPTGVPAISIVEPIRITPAGAAQVEIVNPVAIEQPAQIITETKPKFDLTQKFFAASGKKVIDITEANSIKWTFVDSAHVPAHPDVNEIVITQIEGRIVIFVHSARLGEMGLPGEGFREEIELGLKEFGLGPAQIQARLEAAVSQGRTMVMSNEVGAQQLYQLTTAQYMPYSETTTNNLSLLNPYINRTNPDDIVVVFCGRSHSEAISQGIDLMKSVQSELTAEQIVALQVLEKGDSIGQTFNKAVVEMFNWAQQYDAANGTTKYHDLRVLYDGYTYASNEELLKEKNPYRFSGVRYILGLTPVGGQ
jgi:hypothetical protein